MTLPKKAGFINNSHGNTTQDTFQCGTPQQYKRNSQNVFLDTEIECLKDFLIISCALTNSHHLKKIFIFCDTRPDIHYICRFEIRNSIAEYFRLNVSVLHVLINKVWFHTQQNTLTLSLPYHLFALILWTSTRVIHFAAFQLFLLPF